MRKDRCCSDEILDVRQLSKKINYKKKVAFLVFMDVKKVMPELEVFKIYGVGRNF